MLYFLCFFLDYSPSQLLSNSGITVTDSLPDILRSQVMERMGIADYLQSPECDMTDYTGDGWTNG